MSGFETIEHTADVGIHAWGDGIEEAFEQAAKGMFALMTGGGDCEEKGELAVFLENDALDGLLVDWLSELLYVFDTERLMLCRFEVKIEKNGNYRLRASAFGEKYDPEKHGMHMEIKAVTYHMLEVDEGGGSVRVLFDI